MDLTHETEYNRVTSKLHKSHPSKSY